MLRSYYFPCYIKPNTNGIVAYFSYIFYKGSIPLELSLILVVFYYKRSIPLGLYFKNGSNSVGVKHL